MVTSLADPDEVTRALKGALARRQDDDDPASVPARHVLQAYHRGELTSEREAWLEDVLARSPRARQHLREISARAASNRARSRRWFWAAPALAAAVAAGLFALTPAVPTRLPRYQAEGPTGFVQSVRGATAQQTERMMDSNAVFRLVLRPRLPPDEPVFARVFANAVGAPLSPASNAHVKMKRGVVNIRASGNEMFGDRPGPKRITVAIATTSERLQALAGRTLPQAPDSPSSDLRWWSYTVDYAPSE